MLRTKIIFGLLLSFVLFLPFTVQATPPQQDSFQPYEEVWRLGNGYFTDLEWRPDGEVLAMSTSQGIRFYNQDMVEIDFWEMTYLDSPAWALMEWSPDGKYLATTAYDDALVIWDYESGDKIASYPEDFGIWDIEWHGDSQRIGYTSLSDELSPSDKFYLWEFKQSDPILVSLGYGSVEWSNARNTFILGSYEHGIQQVDLINYNHQTISTATIYKFSVSPDGTKIIMHTSGSVALLDLQVNVMSSTLAGQYMQTFGWNSTSTEVALAGRDGFLIWNIETGEINREIEPEFGVFHIGWHPTQDLIVYASPYEMSYWSTNTGNQSVLNSAEQYLERMGRLFRKPASLISWSSTSNQLALSNGFNISIWDIDNRQLLRQTPLIEDVLNAVEWNPTQNIILGSTGQQGYLWSADSGELLNTYDFASDWIRWHPDGQRFTANPDFSEGLINVYNLDSGGSLIEFNHWGLSSNLTWTPDGQHLISVGTHTNHYIQVWDIETQELANLFRGEDAVVNPTGTTIAITYQGWVYVQDFMTGEVINRFPRGVAAWYPSGEFLAVAHGDAVISLWDVESGELLQELTGHQKGIHSMEWSFDGKYLASVGYDFTIRFWSVK